MENSLYFTIISTVMFAMTCFISRMLYRLRRRLNTTEDNLLRLEAQSMNLRQDLINIKKHRHITHWPVKQIILTITAESYTLTRDLVRCMNQAVTAVQETEFPVQQGLSVTSDGVQIELQRLICTSPPGFFRQCAGSFFPVELSAVFPVPQEKGKRTIMVFVQVTSHGTSSELASYLKKSIQRIEAGEQTGADYDDDNGYAFIVSSEYKS